MNTPTRQPGIKRPISDRLQAALCWIITGSAKEAGELCGIPGRTILNWMEEPSWEILVAEARKIRQGELDAKFTRVIHKAMDELVDRLDRGDEVVTKNGDTVRRKVSAREAAWIAGVLSDKRAILRGTPTSISSKVGGKEERDTLKKQLEALGSSDMDDQAAEKLN